MLANSLRALLVSGERGIARWDTVTVFLLAVRGIVRQVRRSSGAVTLPVTWWDVLVLSRNRVPHAGPSGGAVGPG